MGRKAPKTVYYYIHAQGVLSGDLPSTWSWLFCEVSFSRAPWCDCRGEHSVFSQQNFYCGRST